MKRAARHWFCAAALATLGCGQEVAQTAFRQPAGDEVELSCDEPLTTMPQPPEFAKGDVEATPLATGDYAGGEGPGLWLSARDAYRVYLNGTLVAESQSARASDFIPLSLLPGDNVLAIAIWAEQGTPAAFAQLDELSETYVSDASWRVETAPAMKFAAPDFDDGAWAGATDYGRLGSLPGCDASEKQLESSTARWIGPALGSGHSAVLRRTIRIASEGFGEAATGGGDSAPIVVGTWHELLAAASEPDTPATILLAEGVYDFRRQGDEITERDVCPTFCTEDSTKPQFTVLTPGETCAVAQVKMPLDERTLELGSNKTLVGLGRGARLRGVSFELGAKQNIVLRNLAIFDVNHGLIEAGDALGLAGTRDVWIDHVTAKWISDGLTDVGAGTQNVTLSWMHYDGITSDACRGKHTHAAQLSGSSLTLHHCFFDHTDSHAPLVDRPEARVHIFDDVIQDDEGYGVGAACSAQVLLEATTFKTVTTPTARRGCSDDASLGLISAVAGRNLYLSDVGKHAGGDGLEPHDAVFSPAYDYTLEPAEQAYPRVVERAGAGGPWAPSLALDP